MTPVPDISKERSDSIFIVEQAKFLTLNTKSVPTFETPSEWGSQLDVLWLYSVTTTNGCQFLGLAEALQMNYHDAHLDAA